MRRPTSFDRDFADLHGRVPRDQDFIRHEDVRAGRIVSRVDSPGLRLVVGALGLFWAIVLIGVLVVMVVIAWAMISSVGAPSIQT
jgi:hypothetical protein